MVSIGVQWPRRKMLTTFVAVLGLPTFTPPEVWQIQSPRLQDFRERFQCTVLIGKRTNLSPFLEFLVDYVLISTNHSSSNMRTLNSQRS